MTCVAHLPHARPCVKHFVQPFSCSPHKSPEVSQVTENTSIWLRKG